MTTPHKFEVKKAIDIVKSVLDRYPDIHPDYDIPVYHKVYLSNTSLCVALNIAKEHAARYNKTILIVNKIVQGKSRYGIMFQEDTEYMSLSHDRILSNDWRLMAYVYSNTKVNFDF